MWLPTPLYQRAPQFWLLLGLLFISSGVYMGFDTTMAFVCISVGFFCLAWSGGIIFMRSRNRYDAPPATVTDVTPPLDRTQPVHVLERMHAIQPRQDQPPIDAVRS
jgi:hypothetical protein